MTSAQVVFTESSERMPALFVGHGSPMNAIEDNPFSRAWAEVGRSVPRPRAILCISAHWETRGTKVTAGSTRLAQERRSQSRVWRKRYRARPGGLAHRRQDRLR